ncbi:hypothetical protein JCM6882_004544 [Rhodosporidiobolus microsporus]
MVKAAGLPRRSSPPGRVSMHRIGIFKAADIVAAPKQHREAVNPFAGAGRASDSEDDFDEVHHRELDPLHSVPFPFLVSQFRSIEAITNSLPLGRERNNREREYIRDRILVRVQVQGKAREATAEDVYSAFEYWRDDSGRLPEKLWKQYTEEAESTRILPVPRWYVDRDHEPKAAHLRTWGDFVEHVEWYRTSMLAGDMQAMAHNGSLAGHFLAGEHKQVAERESADPRYRLEDPLDPLNFLLLYRTFTSFLSSTKNHPTSSAIGIKAALSAAFHPALASFLDHDAFDSIADLPGSRTLELTHHVPMTRDEQIEWEARERNFKWQREREGKKPKPVKPLPSYAPSPNALYKAFCLYAQGPPRLQRAHAQQAKHPAFVDRHWVRFCDERLGVSSAAGEKAREAAYARMSWRDWREGVVAHVGAWEREQREFETEVRRGERRIERGERRREGEWADVGRGYGGGSSGEEEEDSDGYVIN